MKEKNEFCRDELIDGADSYWIQCINPDLKPAARMSIQSFVELGLTFAELHAAGKEIMIGRNEHDQQEAYVVHTEAALQIAGSRKALRALVATGHVCRLLGYPTACRVPELERIPMGVTRDGQAVAGPDAIRLASAAGVLVWAAEGLPHEVAAYASRVAKAIRQHKETQQ